MDDGSEPWDLTLRRSAGSWDRRSKTSAVGQLTKDRLMSTMLLGRLAIR